MNIFVNVWKWLIGVSNVNNSSEEDKIMQNLKEQLPNYYTLQKKFCENIKKNKVIDSQREKQCKSLEKNLVKEETIKQKIKNIRKVLEEEYTVAQKSAGSSSKKKRTSKKKTKF